MKHLLACLAAGATALSVSTTSVRAETTPLIGTIGTFATNFCPRGWAKADGRLLPIASYTAVFSLLGTIYGGDGRTTFALPNLQGRANIGDGTGPGLSPRVMGQVVGTETVTETTSSLPSHSHSVTGDIEGNTRASQAGPSTTDPSGAYYATFPGNVTIYTDPSTPGASMGIGSVVFESTASIANAGGSAQTPNVQPNLGMITCVALEGLYPSRS